MSSGDDEGKNVTKCDGHKEVSSTPSSLKTEIIQNDNLCDVTKITNSSRTTSKQSDEKPMDLIYNKSLLNSDKVNHNNIISEINTESEKYNLSKNERTNFNDQESGNSNSSQIVKRTQVILSLYDLNNLSKDELISKWNEQDLYIKSLQESMKEVDEGRNLQQELCKFKAQCTELQKKEQYHIMRLATKEHELQEIMAQVEELKNVSCGGGNALKNSLLDPAVNLLFERMKRELDSSKTKLEETQNELAAWKFTPDSNTGKQLMAKCRLLIKENEELGKMITSGRLAKLEGELALQKSFGDELRKSQSELEEFLQEMDEDTEGMQSTILFLQSELRQAKEKIAQLTSSQNDAEGRDAAAADHSSAFVNPEMLERKFPSRQLRSFAERRTTSDVKPPPSSMPDICAESKENGDVSHTQAKSDTGVLCESGLVDSDSVDDSCTSEIVTDSTAENPSKKIKIDVEHETNGAEETNNMENGFSACTISANWHK